MVPLNEISGASPPLRSPEMLGDLVLSSLATGTEGAVSDAGVPGCGAFNDLEATLCAP